MNHSDEKTKLIHNLVEISKQCELIFGGRTELATELDKRVTELCDTFEIIFLHGLKQTKGVRNFTRKVVSRSLGKSFLNGTGLIANDSNVTFWPFVKRFLNKHEFERYEYLKHVKSESGKGKAWLRSALNEHSLERYISNMLEDTDQLRAQFYEDFALIRDDRVNRRLVEIARNLSGILFAINIDNEDLNDDEKPPVGVQTASPQSEPLPIIMNRPTTRSNDFGLSCSLDKGRRKARKPLRGNLITFDDPDNQINKLSSSLKNEHLSETYSAPSTPTLRNRLQIDLQLTASSNANSSSSINSQTNFNQNHVFRRFPDEERSDEELQIMQDNIPTNVLLTPITTDNCALSDSFAPACEYDAEKMSCSSQNATVNEDQTFNEGDSISFRTCQDQIQQECEERLKKEIELITKKVHVKLARLESQNESLQKENESLKLQLRKYIDAVQLLKPNDKQTIDEKLRTSSSQPVSDGLIDLTNPKSPGESESSEFREESPDFTNYDRNEQLNKKDYYRYRDANEYERKLIQVAEMHGELVEFNDRLHRIVMQKDAAIKRLKDELIELRGPLPEGIQSSDDDELTSIVSDIEPQTLQTPTALISTGPVRPLINIWIPSAFLVGQQQNQLNTTDSLSTAASSASSSHHVYQVYIRIKDEEWNVYRRYSQFFSFHKYLKKKFPQIASLEFPPKKAIGNKHARVVQERRKKLETYLRNAVNIVQVECDLMDKATLIRQLPFLSEKRAMADSDVERDLDSSGHHSRETEDQHYFGL